MYTYICICKGTCIPAALCWVTSRSKKLKHDSQTPKMTASLKIKRHHCNMKNCIRNEEKTHNKLSWIPSTALFFIKALRKFSSLFAGAELLLAWFLEFPMPSPELVLWPGAILVWRSARARGAMLESGGLFCTLRKFGRATEQFLKKKSNQSLLWFLAFRKLLSCSHSVNVEGQLFTLAHATFQIEIDDPAFFNPLSDVAMVPPDGCWQDVSVDVLFCFELFSDSRVCFSWTFASGVECRSVVWFENFLLVQCWSTWDISHVGGTESLGNVSRSF